MPRRVAFQGELGAFGEEAVATVWPNETEAVGVPTFADVVRAVTERRVDGGLLPVENTIAGRVHDSVDALSVSSGVRVVGEIVLPVTQCLLAPHGARIEALLTVESHAIALAQCGDFLRRHPHLAAIPVRDTAGAASDVAAANDLRRGAIAGRRAATQYGLSILSEGIEDDGENCTRFVIIARSDSEPAMDVKRWRRFHAIRGAVTVQEDDPEEIRAATRDLLRAVVARNAIRGHEIISVLFSATSDLTSEFPARAARDLGWMDTPLMCMTEIPVPGALARCIRVMVHVEIEHPRGQMVPVYLRGAHVLRRDLAPSLDPEHNSD